MREGWELVELGQLCDFVKGSSPTQKTVPGEYPLIVTAAEPLSSDSYQLNGEAVCVPMVSSTGHGHASLKRVHYANGKFAVANIIVACVVKDKTFCETRYIWLYLQARKDEIIVPRMKGTANVSLSQRELAKVPVLLPPLPEQRRIIDLIGALDEAIEAADMQVERYRSAYLAIAESLPGQSRSLSKILDRIEAGRSPSGEERQPNADEQAVLKVSAIGPNGFDASEVKTVAPEITLASRSQVRMDDILMVRANGVLSRVGAVCLVPEVPENLYLCDKTLRLAYKTSEIKPQWLLAALKAPAARRQISALCGGSDMRNITQSSIGEIQIPCPDLADQEATSDLLGSLSLNSDSSTDHVMSLRTLRSDLLAALLSGEQEIPSSYDEHLGVVT